MSDSWNCLSVERGPGLLSDQVRNALKVAACMLHDQKLDAMPITRNTVISGIIETEWKTYSLGGNTGVLFRAQIDCEDGENFRVNFLLRKEDLERGVQIFREMEEQYGTWVYSHGQFSVPDLYRFDDLCGPSRRVH